VPTRRLFTATLSSLLVLSALLGALIALVFPAPRVLQQPTPPAFRAGGDIKPAIYTSGDRTPDEQDVWAQLVVTFELVRSSQAMLEEAQALRALAAAIAAGSAEPRADHENAQAPAESDGLDKARRELAEGQLALADKVLGAAQVHADIAQAAFSVAWQNVLRSNQDNAWTQGSAEPLRQSGFVIGPPSRASRLQRGLARRFGAG